MSAVSPKSNVERVDLWEGAEKSVSCFAHFNNMETRKNFVSR